MVREEQPSADQNGWSRSLAQTLSTAGAADDPAISPQITPSPQTPTARKVYRGL
jgi:hypothetical protein